MNTEGEEHANPNSGRRLSLFLRVAIVFLAAVLVWLLVVEGLGPLFGPAYSNRVGHAIRAVLTSALAVPLIALARRHLDRRPWGGLRLTSLRLGWRALLWGMVFWLVAAGVGLATTLALGWVSISFGAPSARVLLLFTYLPLLVFLYEALPEELIFRGYFYRNLADRYARWIAVVGQAALFTLWATAIGAAGSVERVVLFFTFGIVLGVLRALTNNLWSCIGFHLASQWVTQFYSAAVRDGLVRVEGGSALELVALWFFPIVLGSIVLIAVAAVRGRSRWRERDPEPVPP